MTVFNRHGYDEKIDFIKGLCILFVILNHCITNLPGILFPLWGSPAVSLFLLIQVFHSYKRNDRAISFNWKKIWGRILKPFLLVQIFLICIWLICYDLPVYEQVKLILYKGGKGPGSYYIWIYIQFAVLLSFLPPPVIKKLGSAGTLFLFIVLSQLSESVMCLLNFSNNQYQFLCLRYLFLIYLGYQLATTPFVLTTKRFLLAIASLFTLIFFSYSNYPIAPFFYNHPHFTTCHWTCYFYISSLLLYIYIGFYKILATYLPAFQAVICMLGKNSFNIFLSQMALFSLLDIFPLHPIFTNTAGENLGSFLYIALCITLSICPSLILPLFNSKSD